MLCVAVIIIAAVVYRKKKKEKELQDQRITELEPAISLAPLHASHSTPQLVKGRSNATIFLKDITIERRLGGGNFGDVFKGKQMLR